MNKLRIVFLFALAGAPFGKTCDAEFDKLAGRYFRPSGVPVHR